MEFSTEENLKFLFSREASETLELENNQKISGDDNPGADLAIERAIRDYIASRKRKVPHFARKHFSFKGATRLNRKALGHDLYKVPVNVAWAVPLLALRTSSMLLKKLIAGSKSSMC